MKTLTTWLGIPIAWLDLGGRNAVERVQALLITAAAVIAFSVMPIAWNESTLPTIVWTGFAIVAMVAASLLGGFHRLAERRITILVVLYLLLYEAGMDISFALHSGEEVQREALREQARIALVLTAIYFAFGVVSGGRRAVAGFAGAFALIIAYAIAYGSDFTLEGMEARAAEGRPVQYQQLGDAFAICSIVLVSRIRNAWKALALAVVAIPFLFIIPSRSAAFFGSAVLFGMVFLKAPLKGRMALVALGLVTALVLKDAILSSLTEGTRHETVATGDTDESVIGRSTILRRGLLAIKESPFFGEFGFQIREFNFSGFYIHNALDIWVQAGIFAFLAFLMLWVLVSAQWYGLLVRSQARAAEVGPFLAFAALSWALSRNGSYAMLMFCIGYFSGSLMRPVTREEHLNL